jgi:hypothetical protein
MPTYTNKKGEQIPVAISVHALRQFRVRWLAKFEAYLTDAEAEQKIEEWFAKANRVFNLSRQERTRLERHGKDTLFFRLNAFTFVVRNSTIVTVELSDKHERHLNKGK